MLNRAVLVALLALPVLSFASCGGGGGRGRSTAVQIELEAVVLTTEGAVPERIAAAEGLPITGPAFDAKR